MTASILSAVLFLISLQRDVIDATGPDDTQKATIKRMFLKRSKKFCKLKEEHLYAPLEEVIEITDYTTYKEVEIPSERMEQGQQTSEGADQPPSPPPHPLNSEDVIWKTHVIFSGDPHHVIPKHFACDSGTCSGELVGDACESYLLSPTLALHKLKVVVQARSHFIIGPYFFEEIEDGQTKTVTSAYHQIPIVEHERSYTAFEACGQLYQFLRIPFGVTNGVAYFQRVINSIISNEKLNGAYAYLDDITVCSTSQLDHNKNLRKFLEAVKKYGLTLNESKCKFSTKSINLLGYQIINNTIKPDLDRIRPLLDLPIPKDQQSLPFLVETDASDFAITATLSHSARPVAFFSRTLSESERRHSAVEKEAYAIVESLRKWKHYLIGRPFSLLTDQKSVSFMCNYTKHGKIKNEKIECWRLELSCYKFDIVYRLGKDNTVADTLSRACSSSSKRKVIS
ncbi:hypothetical protein ANN_10990 [Periplaneta americana]|uniref:Reverse transcriptase domain-containing protein n=1 Tax=Periplaneta americana TaxID=6978 RepID=A0ABQ8T5I1_PERAM|nr:hypothetical protein ANN_10990 [Periplaneta americana]